MHKYCTYSWDASTANKEKLWNPYEILGIVNTDRGYQYITCIGYAPSQGRRCRNPINVGNTELITKTLNEIAYIRPDNPAVVSQLRKIAGPALCVRWHQGQAGTIVQQWLEKIKQMKPRIEERLSTDPTQSLKKRPTIQDQALEDAQKQLREMKRMVAELREELNRQREQDHGASSRQEEDRKRQEREKERQRSEERDREAKRQEEERLEREKRRKEEEEQERLRKEQQEKERKEKEQRAREQAAYKERIRQRAQKVREERERKEHEQAQMERKEWDRAWAKYQDGWSALRASTSREGNIRDAIPWPVKSGSYGKVVASNVTEFMRMAVPRDVDTAKVMRKECQKWHPDRVGSWLRGAELTEADRMMIDMICRVVTGLLDEAAGKSSEFLD